MKNVLVSLFLASLLLASYSLQAQQDPQIYEILQKIDSKRLEKDIRTLADFGTRHTMSDTLSKKRGIGAARRWIQKEFESISAACQGCLEVNVQRTLVKGDPESRIPVDTWIVNVYVVKRGTKYPNSYVIMSGDIDSRVSDALNFKDDSPGANDNATGMAAAIELARVLSGYEFEHSILLAGLSGEEQGLFGGKFLAEKAQAENWDIVAVINNDMIGNIEGVDGVIDNRTFRIFSEPYSVLATERELKMKRYYGGENDSPSRQLARFIYQGTLDYMPEMNPMMIYRLDRFGRGGHHRPFNELGFPGVRVMEAHENYNRQHQDIREEDGIAYGDVVEGVNFDYVAQLTRVDALSIALLASAPPAPQSVKIGGMVAPSTRLSWEAVPGASSYKLYWRDTTSPTWQYSRAVGAVTEFTLEGIVIDNYLFGVAAVGPDGKESMVAYPTSVMR